MFEDPEERPRPVRGGESSRYDPRPRWVIVLLVIAGVAAAFVLVLLLAGGGHGPGRHVGAAAFGGFIGLDVAAESGARGALSCR